MAKSHVIPTGKLRQSATRAKKNAEKASFFQRKRDESLTQLEAAIKELQNVSNYQEEENTRLKTFNNQLQESHKNEMENIKTEYEGSLKEIREGAALNEDRLTKASMFLNAAENSKGHMIKVYSHEGLHALSGSYDNTPIEDFSTYIKEINQRENTFSKRNGKKIVYGLILLLGGAATALTIDYFAKHRNSTQIVNGHDATDHTTPTDTTTHEGDHNTLWKWYENIQKDRPDLASQFAKDAGNFHQYADGNMTNGEFVDFEFHNDHPGSPYVQIQFHGLDGKDHSMTPVKVNPNDFDYLMNTLQKVRDGKV